MGSKKLKKMRKIRENFDEIFQAGSKNGSGGMEEVLSMKAWRYGKNV